MKYLKKAKVKIRGGLYRRSIEIWSASRGGSKSPITFYYKYRGRWISPFERKTRGWEEMEVISLLLGDIYNGTCLKYLVYQENPFLALVPKDEALIVYGNKL